MLAAHFTDNLALNDDKVLLSVAESVGLSREEVQAVLSSDQYADEVTQDTQEAIALYVQGVPFFVLERKYAISGAQPQACSRKPYRKSPMMQVYCVKMEVVHFNQNQPKVDAYCYSRRHRLFLITDLILFCSDYIHMMIVQDSIFTFFCELILFLYRH